MRLVIISDTHGFHRGMGKYGNPPMPEGDVFIYCGDFSRDFGSWMDAVRFARWMAVLPHARKLLCPGNHDYAMYQRPEQAESLFRECGVAVLGHRAIQIDGVTFDGGPWMPLSGWDPAWAFEETKGELQRLWGRIDHADVLVTHSPPAGILDSGIGCPVLLEHVNRIRPQLHCFGHVHEERGVVTQDGITFMNASSNTRGDYVRDDSTTSTRVTIGIRDAFVHDLVTP